MAYNIEYDEKKNQTNILNRNLPFAMVNDFDFESAVIRQDLRHISEVRMKVIGRIRFHLYALVFTMRGANLRVISFRKANRKEKFLWLSNLIRI
jgi:uncharacterized protein